MWSSSSESLIQMRGVRVRLEFSGKPASFAAVLSAWQFSADFRAMFNAVLSKAPYSAFLWETPPLTSENTVSPFECVVIDSPGLGRAPDPASFADQFKKSPGVSVIAFPNLSGDALMIVPRQVAPTTAYGHLAAFVRDAPEAQHQALWQLVGESLARRVGSKPVWVNTAGAGVPWLHLRLDDRPKYYHFEPYTKLDSPH